MTWNKDHITDFVEELARSRTALARGESVSLSHECSRFVRCWMSRDLPDDQIKYFESKLLHSAVSDVVEMYDSIHRSKQAL